MAADRKRKLKNAEKGDLLEVKRARREEKLDKQEKSRRECGLVDLPYMVLVKICSHLTIPDANNFAEAHPVFEKTRNHYFMTQKTLDLNPQRMRKVTGIKVKKNEETMENNGLFYLKDEFTMLLSHHIQMATKLRTLSAVGLKTFSWDLFIQNAAEIMFCDLHPFFLQSIEYLRMDGCILTSDDFVAMSQWMPYISHISLSLRKFHIYDMEEPNLVVSIEDSTRLTVNAILTPSREKIIKYLKNLFPRLNTVSFV